jgi:putative hydrolase of the HAD superfamily
MPTEPRFRLIFDFAGVIGLPQSVHAIESMATAAGMTVDLFQTRYWEHRREYDLGMTDVDYWHLVLGPTVSAELVHRLVGIDVDSWLDLNDGVVRTAAAHAAAGAEVHILSNAPEALARRVEALPELSFVDEFTFSCDIGCAKPDQETYQLARSNHLPNIFVDDRSENITAAQVAGIDAALFIDESNLRQRLQTFADNVHARYPQIATDN